MAENQNDKGNQSGSKSTQEAFEDGTKKKETNPANPTAKQNDQPVSQPGNSQEKSSTSTTDKTNTAVPGKSVEETTD